MFQKILQAPLLPLALSLSVGMLLQRFHLLPGWAALSLLALAAGGMLFARPRVRLLWIFLSVLALGGWYAESWATPAADDISRLASQEPGSVRLRGVLLEKRQLTITPADRALRAFPGESTSNGVLAVTAIQRTVWEPAGGQLQLRVDGKLRAAVGDLVEVQGKLALPQSPGNPGEDDHRQLLADRGLHAILSAKADAVKVLPGAAPWGWWVFSSWLAEIRAWAGGVLAQALRPQLVGLGRVLLLGEDEALMQEDWEKYQRTGVIHVLSISGQHLTLLASLLWAILGLCGVSQRRGGLLVLLTIWFYAFLTGARPPVVRAAIMFSALLLAVLLRRPFLMLNALALGWIGIALLQPGDQLTIGCQLSFLGVLGLAATGAILLITGLVHRLGLQGLPDIFRWSTTFEAPSEDALDQVEQHYASSLRRWWTWACGTLALVYLTTAVTWLLLVPVCVGRIHLLTPVALLIGPPVALLGTLALFAGFLLLSTAWLLPPVLLGWPVSWCLWGCEWLVELGSMVPGGWWYLPGLSAWWILSFYLVPVAFALVPWLQNRWRWLFPTLLAWLCLGALAPGNRAAGELRCTFLAVGHGSCVVLETPNGQTLLYDAGAITGPQVTRRIIAPFLWSRGIRHLDEVFLSHADLDHFNGLPALLERFSVSQITCTPTFAGQNKAGVQAVMRALGRIPLRIAGAGHRFRAGEVQLRVLHPPLGEFPGTENARSLVLLVEHGEHTILLTGDLEGPGLQRLLGLPPIPVDVLQAPHHGSKAANTAELAHWAEPRYVIASAANLSKPEAIAPIYEKVGAEVFITRDCGAVTVRSRGEALMVETFRKK